MKIKTHVYFSMAVFFSMLAAVMVLAFTPFVIRADADTYKAASFMSVDSPEGIDVLQESEQGIFVNQVFPISNTEYYSITIPERGILIINNKNNNNSASSVELYFDAERTSAVQRYNTNYSTYSSPWLLDSGTYYMKLTCAVRPDASGTHHQWFAYFIPASKVIQPTLSYNSDYSQCTVTLSAPNPDFVNYTYHAGNYVVGYINSPQNIWTSVKGNTLTLTENNSYAIAARWSTTGTAWDSYPIVLDITIDGLRTGNTDSGSQGVNQDVTSPLAGLGIDFSLDPALFQSGRIENPMTAKGRTVKLRYKSLRKKAQVIKRTKAISINKAQGKVTYKLAGVNKKKFKKYFKINKNTGDITVRKKLKKGTYKLKVKISAAGNSNYLAGTKTVTLKVKIK